MTRIREKWMDDPGTVTVMEMLAEGGHRAWFVGGCVRDAIVEKPVTDIDITTDARPERVQELARAVGLHVIETGIEHGTVTVVSGRPFEITTLRRDVETDGRRAVVEYADTIEEDANRRDLTMNAIYADAFGNILDPVGGLSDLAQHKLRFIGNAQDRIREDYLRSLRYFRFFAWYGRSDVGPDQDALAAISSNLDGIDTVSRERIGSELVKLLSAPDPGPAVALMASTGILHRILPGSDAKFLPLLVHLENGIASDPIRRLAAICADQPGDKLRLSKIQSQSWARVSKAAREGTTPGEAAYRMGAKLAFDASLVHAALTETPLPAGLDEEIQTGANATFPISAADLRPLEGRALGEKLRDLEARWIASNFLMTKQALLA